MILIINKSHKDGNSAVEIFRYMGILARAEAPDTAFSEISLMYRAVLVMNPYKLPDEKDYIKALRSYAGKLPVFAISNREIANKELYDMTFPEDITSSKLLLAILDYCEEHNHLLPGEYMLSGMNASIDLGGVTYFNDVIPFTKTETSTSSFKFLKIALIPLSNLLVIFESSSQIAIYTFYPHFHLLFIYNIIVNSIKYR